MLKLKNLRRKSVGNALDSERTAEPSFRVLERPGTGNRSIDGVNQNGHARKHSDPYPDNIFAGLEKDKDPKSNRYGEVNSATPNGASAFAPAPNSAQETKPLHNKLLTKIRGSSGTNNSSSTGRPYGSSSSSAKYSSSSTLPSSAGASSHDVPPIPESPFSFSLRAAGRTFSFGSKTKTPTVQSPPSRPQTKSSLSRPMTTSTSSTATPPRLPESNLRVVNDGDWDNMFDGIDKRKSTTPSPAPQETTATKEKRRTLPGLLAPLRLDRKKNEPSPTSTNSDNSADGLMGQGYSEPATTRSLVPPPATTSIDHSHSNVTDTFAPPIAPGAALDPDMSSIYGSDNDFTHIPLNREAGRSTDKKQSELAPFSMEASIAARYEKALQDQDQAPSKVMTASQFEKYRQQKELARQNSNASGSSKSDNYDDEEEDEDEAEKRRQAANMRKKQEAHLAVYRQQMMKVTGQTNTTPNPLRTSTWNGTPTAADRSSTLLAPPVSGTNKSNGSTSEGDDDEDTPLGVLLAHGFPNSNRPPTRLQTHSSNPNLRAALQPSFVRPSSGSGHRENNNRLSTLPPFARNLPADPYYGASLVNQANRQSLAMRGPGTTPTVPVVPPGLPPGGLVQIIAQEEEAKIARRGSPNTPLNMRNSTIGGPGTLLGQHEMRQSYMPQMEMPLMNQQGHNQPSMNQLMQMQMEFMNNMMAMQNMQNMQMGNPAPVLGPNMPMQNGYLSPHMQAQPRPVSMAAPRPQSTLSNHGFAPVNPRQYDQRTLSMLDPSMSSRNRQSFASPLNFGGPPPAQAPGYAPSIAPSERSNIGKSARYRPVSMAPTAAPVPGLGSRSSTTPAYAYQPAHNSFLAPPDSSSSPAAATTASTPSPTAPTRPLSTLRHAQTTPANSSALRKSVVGSEKEAEGEDDGWGEMLEAREKRKNGWRFKKSVSGIGDLFSGNTDKV